MVNVSNGKGGYYGTFTFTSYKICYDNGNVGRRIWIFIWRVFR